MMHGSQRLDIGLDRFTDLVGYLHCLLDLSELATALGLSRAHIALKFISWSEPDISFHSFHELIGVYFTSIKLLVQVKK